MRCYRFVRRLGLAASLALVATWGAGLHAEIVVLRKGPPVEGRIVRQTAASIEVTTPKGNKTILKQDIVRIQYVAVTNEQKRLLAEKQRKLEAERKAERERIERERMAEAEKARRLKELEERVLAEKKKEAQERADRAAALRDLVQKGQMEKPADEPISYMDFAWRSLLVPGWGHFTLDRPVIGTIYVSAWVGLLANAAYRYPIGLRAQKVNHQEVFNNTILYLQPSLGAPAVRSALVYDANARALTKFQKKIDAGNQSLYLLGVFYGAQLLHIVYNGIAWENGLLIVDKGDEPQEGSFRPILALGPDEGADGRIVRGSSAQVGLVYYF